MAYLKNKNRERWWVRNSRCLGAVCLTLGDYRHPEALLAKGSPNTARPCCLYNVHHGCPEVVIYSPSLAKQRRDNFGLMVERS
jgi:hypothetical protein